MINGTISGCTSNQVNLIVMCGPQTILGTATALCYCNNRLQVTGKSVNNNTQFVTISYTQCPLIVNQRVKPKSTVTNPEVLEFNLFPNPNTGTFTINYDVQYKQSAYLSIYDITGKKMATYNLENGKNTITVINRDLNPGLYLYSVTTDNIVLRTGKLIVK